MNSSINLSIASSYSYNTTNLQHL